MLSTVCTMSMTTVSLITAGSPIGGTTGATAEEVGGATAITMVRSLA